MARSKKKENLTPEERLQAALIPDAEQPYKVPENWCWVRLGASINLYNGDRGTNYPSKKDYQSSGIPFINAGAIADGELNEADFNYISEEKYNALRAGKIQQGDLLYCLRGSLGKTAIVHQKLKGAISSSLCILRTKESMLKEFLYYLLCSNVIWNQQALAENGSAQPNLSAASVMEYMIPLPPLPEQQRIVDRIESLFTKLDEAKQKAQDALDSFETRKAAILHKAFTGELTAQWRKEHGVEMESWEKFSLKNVAQIGSGGTPSRKNPQYYLGNIPWVKTGEIYWNCIYDSQEKITEEAIENSSAKLYPAGTVLVAMYGQGLTRGRAAILEVKATINQAVCALQPYDCLEKKYLYYYFMENYWEYREKAVGGNQPNYSATMIGNWIIDTPSVPEQTEIVRILDDLLTKEQQAKEAAENVLEQIELIKKSILARAFRGELGTNDPNDENAVELVKEIVL